MNTSQPKNKKIPEGNLIQNASEGYRMHYVSEIAVKWFDQFPDHFFYHTTLTFNYCDQEIDLKHTNRTKHEESERYAFIRWHNHMTKELVDCRREQKKVYGNVGLFIGEESRSIVNAMPLSALNHYHGFFGIHKLWINRFVESLYEVSNNKNSHDTFGDKVNLYKSTMVDRHLILQKISSSHVPKFREIVFSPVSHIKDIEKLSYYFIKQRFRETLLSNQNIIVTGSGSKL